MDSFSNLNNSLYHHGIKGMHWGIRRTPEELGYKKQIREQKRQAAKDAKLERKKEHNPKLYSVSELKERIARLQMEKQYKELYREIHSSEALKIGRELVRNSLLDTERVIAKGAMNVMNWGTEKPLWNRIGDMGIRGVEATGNLVGSVAKLVRPDNEGKKKKKKNNKEAEKEEKKE